MENRTHDPFGGAREHAITARSPGSGRAAQLQFLRFLAFCIVFVWHTDHWSIGLSSRGYGAACAVAFFFMLSGVATGYSHFDRPIPATPANIGGYLLGKLKRIYPLYAFSMLFAVMASRLPRLVAGRDLPGMKAQLALLVRNALMIQAWFPTDYFSFNGVGWFISSIMFLYVLTLPILQVAWQIRRSKRPAVGFCACACGLALAAAAYCYVLRETQTEYTQFVLPVARVWEYAAGICLGCLARMVKRRLPRLRRSGKLAFTAVEAAALGLWLAAPYHTAFPAWQLRIVRWLPFNALLLFAFAVGAGYLSDALRAGPLVSLGNLSFECFLLHQVIITVYGKCNAFGESGMPGNAFNLAFCMLLTLLLARLVHRGGQPGTPRWPRA